MSILNAVYISLRPAFVVGVFWGCFAAYVPHIKAQLGSATRLVPSMWSAPILDRKLGARALQAGIFHCCLRG